MKCCLSLFIAALIALVLSGCLKHPKAVATPNVTYINLGAVQVSDGTPIRHTLSDGRTYILTPTILKDGRIDMRLDLQVTNSSGAVETLQGPTDCVFAGDPVSFSVNDVGIKMTPKAKL
jgi:hypothetical protein